MMWTLRREWPSFDSGESWCFIKEPSITARHQLASCEKLCNLQSPQLIEWLLSMNVTEMPDTRVTSKCCTYCRTSSGGLAWPHRCIKWSSTANDTSIMKALVPRHQSSPSLPPLLWSYYTYTSWVLRQLWAAPTTKCGECSGFLQLLHETCLGLHDPWPNCKDLC